MEDVLDFLSHASDRGLMPAATATALGVAVRNVLGVLTDEERHDLGQLDLDAVVKRFNNKRARDFSPSSLKEYGRRVQRAIELYQRWQNDPANFAVKTRATSTGNRKQRNGDGTPQQSEVALQLGREQTAAPATPNGGYASSIPIRPNWVVTVTNIPVDLTVAESERLTKFIRMLAVEQ